jgi:hypothetical protein
MAMTAAPPDLTINAKLERLPIGRFPGHHGDELRRSRPLYLSVLARLRARATRLFFADTPRDRKKWLPSELALVIAFHKYARLNPSIKVPSFFDLLKEYLFNTVSRLFQKYGWEAGQPDCATLRPLREWAPGDRRRMIEMLGQVCDRLDAEISPNDP